LRGESGGRNGEAGEPVELDGHGGFLRSWF
jgi:hypothetical protein